MNDEARDRDEAPRNDAPHVARELDSSRADATAHANHDPNDAAQLDPTTATDTPSPDSDTRIPRPAARLFVPRGLVLFASVWAFASWLYLFGFDPPIQSQAGSYGPSMHLLMVAFGVGIGIGWPLLRLSAAHTSAPIAQCALDAISLLTLAQVVLWPLRLVTTWTITRMIAMDVALAMSIAFVAALLSLLTGRPSTRVRTGAMLMFVVLALTPAALRSAASLVGSDIDLMSSNWLCFLAVSPPALLGTLAAAVPLDPSDAEVTLVKYAGFAAGFAWFCVMVCAMVDAIMRRRHAQ